MVAGLIYDLAGGYGPFLAAGAIYCTLGEILMITLPTYPVWQERKVAVA